ncbi:hypothetical protein [Flavobacterium sp.]|uniref:hypothetical protein n=1 Tax=Flavobacterium sp. TaxID=239 RepID=UPI0012079F68|nr:hypothetical protein [Flavobacterium sp.]RZJ72985.1 MAG: hypothetical protein EOO49_04980 [Flavobacterium sp.]
MKTQFLFPRRFKMAGVLLFVIGFVMAVFLFNAGESLDQYLNVKVFAIADSFPLGKDSYFSFIENSIFDEIAVILLILGGLFVGFSRTRNEDEYIAQIRYESLIWAVYFNFAVMLFCTIFIFGTYYFTVISINIFSLLLFFVIRFHIKLYQLQKSLRDDE